MLPNLLNALFVAVHRRQSQAIEKYGESYRDAQYDKDFTPNPLWP
jgi:hypothetical protein